MHKDGVEVINVHHKNVLHGFEGADREHNQEVGLYCACVEISKGSKTKHVIGSADFFGWLETVNVAPSLYDGWLYGTCGLNALLLVPHVALVGCRGNKQAGIDTMYHEAGDGCKFLASF
jgi:hypothetical protein